MRSNLNILLVFILACSVNSQGASGALYGSTKQIKDSSFCKKYKCNRIELAKNKKFTIETYLFEYASYGDAAKSEATKQTAQWNLIVGRNLKNQIDYVSVEVGSRYSFTGYFEWEQQFIVDVLNNFLGLNYKFVSPGSDDNWRDPINKKCLEKATPEKKYHVLERGSKLFEGDKIPTQFLAYCAIKPSREKPNDYPKVVEPLFMIYNKIYILQ